MENLSVKIALLALLFVPVLLLVGMTGISEFRRGVPARRR